MPWAEPEVDIDERLVRRLIADQHPDLAGRPTRRVDAGLDNVVWRLGADLAIRMPRRKVAAHLVEREMRWLPLLAEGLPLPVPVPRRAGRPGYGYPWPWTVVTWLEGEAADRTPVLDQAAAAVSLASFMRALHRPAPTAAPVTEARSAPLATRTPLVEERLTRLRGHLQAGQAVALRELWDRALSASPHHGPPRWIHGDLHPANLLVSGGRLCGVIDFGDVCAGDPATDAAGAWLLLDREAVGAFFVHYLSGAGPPAGSPTTGEDTGLVARSLGWAVHFGLMLLEVGAWHRPTYAVAARSAICRLTARVHQLAGGDRGEPAVGTRTT